MKSIAPDQGQLRPCGQLQCRRVVIVEQRVTQFVIFVGKFQSRLIKGRPFLHTVSLGEGTRRQISHNDLQRHNGDPLHQRFPTVQLPDKVSGDPLPFQPRHQQIAHLVIDDSLSLDGPLFRSIERGGVVFIGHDEQFGILGRIDPFCLSLIK